MTAENKPAAPVKAEKLTQNGVSAPAEGTTSAAVWAIADEQSAALGAPAKRADVLAACTERGFNPATAATQFGRWCKFNGLVVARPAKEEGSEEGGDDAGEEGAGDAAGAAE